MLRSSIIRFSCAPALALAALCLGSPADAKRVALVIGNNDYENVADLQKAVNDARAVGNTLKDLGYELIAAEDVHRREMNRKLQEFSAKIGRGDEALFFFAGHGVEISGQNFLLPTDIPDASPGQEGFVKVEAVGVHNVLDMIRGRGGRVAILVLDACRNNPFRRSGTRSLGGTRGLARMVAPEGTFIMYSAGVGQEALDRLGDDDPHPNSIFTRTLIPLLKTPGLKLTETARQVRREVQKLAAAVPHEQRPAYYDEVTGEFYFTPGGVDASAPSVTSGASQDETLWAMIKDSKKASDFEFYLSEHPMGRYSSVAKLKIKQLKETKVAVGVYPETSTEREYKPGDTFKDCDQCPEMVVVPAGSFMMGSPKSEKIRHSMEGPQRRVTIAKPFAVGKHEVTFAQWDACVAGSGCKHTPEDEGWGRGKQPVLNVSWDDAKEYVVWLSTKTGKSYRLLSEAEWEYAARAGTATPFSTGEMITTDQANFIGKYTYGGSPKGVYRAKTVEVGTFKPNAFGLYDMHGNVWEWVEDCYRDSYKGSLSDGSAVTSGECGTRFLRGGAWNDPPQDLRSAFRLSFSTDHRIKYIGFRVGRTLSP